LILFRRLSAFLFGSVILSVHILLTLIWG
jgi:hypothetical protein